MKRTILRMMMGLIILLQMVWGITPALAQNFAKRVQKTTVDKPEQAQNNAQKELTPEEILRATTAMDVVDDTAYTLGREDVIEVTVMRHPEVSGQYIINGEGKIQYEFIGDLPVAGMTKDEVKVSIVEKLSKFIVSPDVTVKIVGYNSKVVYVVGEVGNPGKIFMRGDTITIREALLAAGLPTLTASLKKSRLITPANNGKASQKYVNVEALLYEGDLRQNFVMKPGDTLYIPATILAKAMRMINPVAQPIGTAGGAARTVYTKGF